MRVTILHPHYMAGRSVFLDLKKVKTLFRYSLKKNKKERFSCVFSLSQHMNMCEK